MCNCSIRMCVSCTGHTRRESPCPTFARISESKGYDDMFNHDWMIEHVKEDPGKVKVNVTFAFCPTCKPKDKIGFKPDVKKVSKAAEEATLDCLGTFTFTYTNGKVINSWAKTEFGKVDPDKYMTTDAEAGEDESEDESSSGGEEEEEEESENENEEEQDSVKVGMIKTGTAEVVAK